MSKNKGTRKLGAAIGVGLALAAVHDIHAHAHPAAGGGAADTAAATVISAGSNVALGRRLAARDYDWRGTQWSCLDTLWEGESGWSQYADTRRSHLDAADATVFAYGIPQARPATKMPLSARPADLGGSSNRRAQILWGLRYIDGRYGSPCAALAFKRANNNEGY